MGWPRGHGARSEQHVAPRRGRLATVVVEDGVILEAEVEVGRIRGPPVLLVCPVAGSCVRPLVGRRCHQNSFLGRLPPQQVWCIIAQNTYFVNSYPYLIR